MAYKEPKYYAVRKGRKPGIYRTWGECRDQVHGYSGAEYKSFITEWEAEEFLKVGYCGKIPNMESEAEQKTEQKKSKKIATLPDVYAFVDGSYNSAMCIYGYGGFLMVHGEKYVLQGAGGDRAMASMHNVAGEICGTMAAIEKAIELGLNEIVIYYDYAGIEKWAKDNEKQRNILHCESNYSQIWLPIQRNH